MLLPCGLPSSLVRYVQCCIVGCARRHDRLVLIMIHVLAVFFDTFLLAKISAKACIIILACRLPTKLSSRLAEDKYFLSKSMELSDHFYISVASVYVYY